MAAIHLPSWSQPPGEEKGPEGAGGRWEGQRWPGEGRINVGLTRVRVLWGEASQGAWAGLPWSSWSLRWCCPILPYANIIKNILGFLGGFFCCWLVFKIKENGQTGPPYLSLYRLLHGLFAVDVDLLVAWPFGLCKTHSLSVSSPCPTYDPRVTDGCVFL